MTAIEDAVAIVADVLAGLDDALPDEQKATAVMDALSGRLHAELAVEQGGMEPCGYRWRQSTFGTWVVHHWPPDDFTQRWPVYRLTEENDRG